MASSDSTQMILLEGERTNDSTPLPTARWKVHAALVFGQVCFGAGSILTFIGIREEPSEVHPFVYVLYRGILAAILLLLASYHFEKEKLSELIQRERSESKSKAKSSSDEIAASDDPECPRGDGESCQSNEAKNGQKTDTQSHWKNFRDLIPCRDRIRFFWLGAMLYGYQACFLAGLALRGSPLTGTVWLSFQPLLVAAVRILIIGTEPIDHRRIVALLIAFGGCVFVVGHDHGVYSFSGKAANGFFLISGLCYSLFVILSRSPSLQRYPPLWIAASAYSVASWLMVPTAIAIKWSPELSRQFCPKCYKQYRYPLPEENWFPEGQLFWFDSPKIFSPYWSIPWTCMWAMGFDVVLGSVMAYGIFMWANKKKYSGTLVLSYTLIQPITVCILAVVLVLLRIVRSCPIHYRETTNAFFKQVCLGLPDGMAGIFAYLLSLWLVYRTEDSFGQNNTENSMGNIELDRLLPPMSRTNGNETRDPTPF